MFVFRDEYAVTSYPECSLPSLRIQNYVAPACNSSFGAPQIVIVNPGKFSVDYLWQWRQPPGPAVRLSGAKHVGDRGLQHHVGRVLSFLRFVSCVMWFDWTREVH